MMDASKFIVQLFFNFSTGTFQRYGTDLSRVSVKTF